MSPLLLEESSFFAFEVTADASDDLFSLRAMASALQPSLLENFDHSQITLLLIRRLSNHTLPRLSEARSHSSSFQGGDITLLLVLFSDE